MISQLAQVCVDRLNAKDAPAMDAIKMQVEVEREYIVQGNTLAHETNEKEEKAMSLEFEITSTRYKAEKDDTVFFSGLYRKIYKFVVANAGIESAFAAPEAEAETLAALESVFPQHGLRRFLSLSREDKSAQLKELTSIVMGIRIFNKSIGKGGVGMHDPVEPYIEQAEELSGQMKGLLIDTQRELEKYELVTTHLASLHRPSDPMMLRIRDEHNNRVAMLDLAQFLLEQVEKGLATVNGLAEQYNAEQKEMQDLVGARHSIPKEQVYPKLEALGMIYALLLQESRTLEVLQQVTSVLMNFASTFVTAVTSHQLQEASSSARANPLLSDSGPPTSANPEEDAKLYSAEKLTWEEACGGEALPKLRCGGLSPVTAVKRAGLLLRAVPEAGCVRWNNALYGFANPSEADQFCTNPENYIAALDNVAATMPEIVRLLRIEESFPSLRMAGVVDCMATPVTCDFGTQTPTHFIDKHIDRNYEWNEWALRRRVLALTNLRQKQTHSMQTADSHFRREQQTQVWLPKESTTQTAVQKGTSMPQKKMYIAGLRGAPNVAMNVVTVDLDLGQPHEY
mmetsp:Transcript_14406/g.17463  ORF Transcript_14406/g.17463 Transcript_14406/m.17463 type:complete len:568 (-) Transcript_14406:619-2322(-)